MTNKMVPESSKFFASGPEGHFFTDNAELANKMIRQTGFDRDDWTVTDISAAPEPPSVEAGELPGWPMTETIKQALLEYADLQDMARVSGGSFPIYLNSNYTGERCRQIANSIFFRPLAEIEVLVSRMASAYLETVADHQPAAEIDLVAMGAALQAAQLALGHSRPAPVGVVDDAMVEPVSCRIIPDWAIARAYRQAVDRIAPQYPPASALVMCANITIAADRMAEEHRRAARDYSIDPRSLAEWMRIHWRSSWDNMPKILPPELFWIYDFLLASAALTPAAPVAESGVGNKLLGEWHVKLCDAAIECAVNGPDGVRHRIMEVADDMNLARSTPSPPVAAGLTVEEVADLIAKAEAVANHPQLSDMTFMHRRPSAVIALCELQNALRLLAASPVSGGKGNG